MITGPRCLAMRLPRMTTRRWIVAVAVVGIVLAGVEVLRQRRAFALAMASRHTASAAATSPFDLRNLHHDIDGAEVEDGGPLPLAPFRARSVGAGMSSFGRKRWIIWCIRQDA